jgi:hypothetical protein
MQNINEDKEIKESEFSNFLFNLVQEFYNDTLLKNYKPKEEEHNIFSSIILENKKEFKVITFSSGTRSIPNKNLENFSQFKIKDSHAEILSLRSLKIFLIKTLKFSLIINSIKDKYSEKDNNLINNIDINNIIFNKENYLKLNLNEFFSFEEFEAFSLNKNFFDIFDLSSNEKIKLKNFVNFHLYISELPCGDCSIFQIDEKENNNNNNSNQTGAKSIKEILNALEKNRANKENNLNKFFILHDNEIMRFRSKSMRSDIKIENITFSISCTDKILFKNFFGIQGKFLYEIFEPIFLSSILISSKYEINNKDTIINSIDRGLDITKRINKNFDIILNEYNNLYTNNSNKFLLNKPKIFLLQKNLIGKKINLNEENLINSNKKEKIMQGFSIIWYFSNKECFKIDPNSGFKQGTVQNKDRFNLEKAILPICKIENFKMILRLFEIYTKNDINFRNYFIDLFVNFFNKNYFIYLNSKKQNIDINNISNIQENIASDIDKEINFNNNNNNNNIIINDLCNFYDFIKNELNNYSIYKSLKNFFYKKFEINEFLDKGKINNY